MARQGKGIFDSFSGNIGDIQGSKYGNLGVIKSKNKKSVKTQTQALTKTKNDYKLALHFYEGILDSDLGVFFNREMKGKTAKNHFIGEIIKLLNVDSDQIINLPLFPGSIPYDRMQCFTSVNNNRSRWRFRRNMQPLSPLALASDRRSFIAWNEYNGDIWIELAPGLDNRGVVAFNNNWNLTEYPAGKRRLWVMFFCSADFTRVFNAYAIAGNGF